MNGVLIRPKLQCSVSESSASSLLVLGLFLDLRLALSSGRWSASRSVRVYYRRPPPGFHGLDRRPRGPRHGDLTLAAELYRGLFKVNTFAEKPARPPSGRKP